MTEFVKEVQIAITGVKERLSPDKRGVKIPPLNGGRDLCLSPHASRSCRGSPVLASIGRRSGRGTDASIDYWWMLDKLTDRHGD
jgi:hypothetical protein